MKMKTIAAALVKAQKGFSPALKTSTNPHFRSKYADLSACVEAVIDSLNDNGIALIQNQHECSDGVIIETVFLHESGEQYSAGKLHVPASKADPQGYGSALTYARRYSLMAACGIAPEDDDGNAASKKPVNPPRESAKSIAVDVWEKITQEEREFLQGIAMDMLTALNDGDVEKAHSLFYCNNLDNEQQIALWSRFDSKQRAAIKAFNEKLKKVA